MRVPVVAKHAMRLRSFVLAPLILLTLTTSADAVGREMIALDHWAYDVAERFEALGVCLLPTDRPFTRDEFIGIVEEIRKGAYDRRLSPRDRFNLYRLEKEFTEFASRRSPSDRYDVPTFLLDDRPLLLETDIDATAALESRAFDEETEAFLGVDPSMRLHFGDRITYEVRYRLLMGPEHGNRARDRKPNRRLKSFKGLTSQFDRSYVMASWDKVHIFFGREYVDWGPSDWSSLIVPGEKISLDQFGARVKMKNLRLSSFVAQLSPTSGRQLAGHRLEGRFGNTVVGINETAIYGNSDFEFLYAFPLSSFYANQFNERNNDQGNILWSVDVKTRLWRNVVLHASGVVDDAQFERDGENPDKFGFDIGGRYAVVEPIPLTLRAGFRWVDIFTYSHMDSVNTYVSGEGLVGEGDIGLGGAPGPDTESWQVAFDVHPQQAFTATFAVFSQRRGEGNDYRAFQEGGDIDPKFPSGVVERQFGYSISCRFDLRNNSELFASYQYVDGDNLANVVTSDETSSAFRLAVRWDF